ncbi:hypothetical protein FHS39_002573 [Streptomyces olivoverticillatus]|uniref:Uncharacterized protein n=1 Tax=Streptomyces olivoverticillatus TaxID=66427 RepID=A0A7W7LPD2_9ACTN|nr:hypothetical protein [Streptomyces olivoverticillatus]MBB4893542.1 hypothetical protein [Streptomyces olivoverticillatus]
MKQKEDGTRARVFAAALRNWATIDADPAPTAVRLDIRQPPDWAYAATINITARQHQRVLAFLHDDVAENKPGHSTPECAATVINALLTEHRIAGRSHITAADLVNAAPRIGRSRTWIAAHITELIDTGRLGETRRPGRFRL